MNGNKELRGLPRTTRRVIGVVAACVFACSAATAQTAPDEIPGLLGSLRSMKPSGAFFGGTYFDMHGNPCRELRALLEARFDATAAVMHEIEKRDPAAAPEYVGVLYHALGRVKDPSTIDFIRKQLRGQHATYVRDNWLPGWGPYWGLRVPYQEVKWLTGAERWSVFFRAEVGETAKPDLRKRLLEAMYTFLHDRSTVEFFEHLAQAEDTPAEERLIAMAYLQQHRRPFDVARLAAAIGEMAAVEAPALPRYCHVMRHEAFIPWLLSETVEARDVRKGRSGGWLPGELSRTRDLNLLMRRITFVRDVSGLEEWRSWYQEHREGRHSTWVDEAMRLFEKELEADPSRALSILRSEGPSWYGPGLHHYVRRWLKHKELHLELVRWLACSDHPAWREDLLPIAREILRESRVSIEDSWQFHFFLKFDVIDGDTWQEYCRQHRL